MSGDTFGRSGPGDHETPEHPRLRQLRWLVNGLTVTLIVGVITIVAVLVIRLSSIAPAPLLPEALALPPGETAQAVTLGTGWVAVVTRDAAGTERIRVLDAATGTERAAVTFAPAE